MYYVDTVPEYTLPYYDYVPRRPRGVFVSASLHPFEIRDISSPPCASLPSPREWHLSSTNLSTCGQGIVIYSSCDTILPVRASPMRGSGCNAIPALMCTPLYPLLLPLREGRNNIVWCTDSSIAVVHPRAILDPWQDVANDFGSVIYFPPSREFTLTNYIYDGTAYQKLGSNLMTPIQPVVMSRLTCADNLPPRITFLTRRGEVPPLNSLCQLQTGRGQGVHRLAIFPRSFFYRESSLALRHLIADREITPPTCLCGCDYFASQENYTTGEIL